MARMYSRKKGKARSKTTIKKTVPLWARYKAKELELLIVKLAKEGNTPSKIGLILRDTYGIPSTKIISKKNITQILKEKDLLAKLPEDLLAFIKKADSINKHLERNKKDEVAKRGLLLTESRIRKISKYYKRTGRLDAEWKFDIKKAGMYVE